MDYFTYFWSMIRDDARGKHGKLNPGLPWQSSFQQVDSFHQQTGLKFKEETNNVLHLQYSFVWYWNLDTLESRSEICRNVVSEKDGDQLDQFYEKWRNVTNSQGGKEI